MEVQGGGDLQRIEQILTAGSLLDDLLHEQLMGVKSLSQWCIVLVNAHNAVCASLSSRGDTASIAPVLSVDVLVVPPTCWILSAGFAPMHKTAGYLPFLCLFFIYGANWQIAHYSHASAALYLLQ